MTTSYFPQDDDWYDGDWYFAEEYYDDAPLRSPFPVDLIALGAVLFIVVLLIAGLSQVNLQGRVAAPAPARSRESAVEEAPVAPPAPPLSSGGAERFIMPYTEYILTQGPHGMSYGHYAIDLAAGKGEPVLSPINGRVTELLVDAIGNPTLVIENDLYTVTMLHGIYEVELGQEVEAGQQVGIESNKGNTRDMAGRSCRNRDCGYHTHLNVFSKRDGQNVNPLDLLPQR